MIRLEIAGTPPSLNKWMRQHWTVRQAMNHEWAWLIKAACLSAKAGQPRYHLARVDITLIFPVVRRRDIDNYAPKMILDGLVNAGIIQDDRNDWVDVKWHIVKGNERRTIIDIAAILT